MQDHRAIIIISDTDIPGTRHDRHHQNHQDMVDRTLDLIEDEQIRHHHPATRIIDDQDKDQHRQNQDAIAEQQEADQDHLDVDEPQLHQDIANLLLLWIDLLV